MEQDEVNTYTNNQVNTDLAGLNITEFNPAFTNEVKNLVLTVLGDLGIGPKELSISRDSDLDRILETYKGRGRFWLALKSDELVGTVGIQEVSQHTAKLKRMFVLPELQGTGVGQRLLDTALKFAKDQGYQKIVLNTDKVMNRAHKFYEKNGFSKVGEDQNRFFYEQTLI